MSDEFGIPEVFGEPFPIWVSTTNSDSAEGRGEQVPRNFFMTKEEALFDVKGRDVMGSDGRAQRRWAIIDQDGQVWLLDRTIEVSKSPVAMQYAAARKKLMSALSREERKLLGIKL